MNPTLRVEARVVGQEESGLLSIFDKMRWQGACALSLLLGAMVLPSAVLADHGTGLDIALPVEVRKGAPGSGGWFFSITADDEVRVGTYRAGGDLETDWMSYAAPFGSYDAVRDVALAEIAAVERFDGEPCAGYLRDVVMVVTAVDTSEAVWADCPHAPTAAALDRVADMMRAWVP